MASLASASTLAGHAQLARRRASLSRRRRDDLRVGLSGLVAALLALPLAASGWHGPEVAATLAVAATSLLAGQRWAVGLVVLAELLLVPTVAARALALPGAHGASGAAGASAGELASVVALAAVVPGLRALRRGAAALVLLLGRPRTQRTCRRVQRAMVAAALAAAVLPIL